MTIHEAIFSPVRQPLSGILYLLLTAQMALLFAAFLLGRSRRYRLGLLLHTLASFLCLWFLFMDIDSNHFRTDVPIPLPAPRSAFTGLPVWTLFLYEAVTAVILLVLFLNMLRYRKEHPTFESIKETMDLLPAGIAYAVPEDIVVFSNLTMSRMYRTLREKPLTDLSDFREALQAEGQADPEHGLQVTLPTGTVWQTVEKKIFVDAAPYTQLTATDVTRQTAVTKELAGMNARLLDIQERLAVYNRQAARIVAAQELLTARMAVHNELGSILLESRHYLNDPSAVSEENLLQALKNTNTSLLREYEQEEMTRDPLAEALKQAETIGVRVEITGVLPGEEEPRSILAAAVIECATNAVKHADGDTLTLLLKDTGRETVYTLQTNGRPPEKAITESGGLLSLRTLVEAAKGTMKLEDRPLVKLTITLPKEAKAAAE